MKRYKGSDHALVELFKEAKKDVLNYLKEDKYNG
jgi:predicted glycosyltransferase involved in capsule biosynthesis